MNKWMDGWKDRSTVCLGDNCLLPLLLGSSQPIPPYLGIARWYLGVVNTQFYGSKAYAYFHQIKYMFSTYGPSESGAVVTGGGRIPWPQLCHLQQRPYQSRWLWPGEFSHPWHTFHWQVSEDLLSTYKQCLSRMCCALSRSVVSDSLQPHGL